ncbi:dehydrogenase/reductase SDR family member on chromosome X-like isoform X4 [Pseudomyrmex gracilis]|uniref:dehydrogenase/reductase SDR family member on chromosome X-like isoform X4 n=1 Tax=Pseudomyrmex gracilis TaxID=219809 RepID=UPI000994975C|nr:dehydrogenase/reductase SDR family member on chromosome X-like isoform X4 [Pseudomyrmex gracilis]
MLLEVISICVLAFGTILYTFRKSQIGMDIYYTIRYFYCGIKYWLYDVFDAKYNKISDLPSMPDKIAIVTGASRGIGAEVVKKLLQCNMEVIIAGVMFSLVYTTTKDGFEEQWAINYLSHFLLTFLLLPLLEAGGQPDSCSRIINVTSCANTIGDMNFNYIKNCSKNTYCRHLSYAESKLAQTVFTITLHKLLKNRSVNVQVYSVHPGIVRTDLFKNTFFAQDGKWLTTLWKTPEQGAIPIVYVAVNKDVEIKSGTYFSNCKEVAAPSLALKEDIQKELFELTLKQVKLSDFFQLL